MKFSSTINQMQDGNWSACHESAELGRVKVTAPTSNEATEKLRREIRYRLELCPCSGETYQYVEIDISGPAADKR